MLYCTLCENEVCIVSRFCEKCRRIKWYLNLYGDRVHTVLESVLSRDKAPMENKINNEIKKEIESKKGALDKKNLI